MIKMGAEGKLWLIEFPGPFSGRKADEKLEVLPWFSRGQPVRPAAQRGLACIALLVGPEH